jgi:alpha-aminoadipate carrier protein LysW
MTDDARASLLARCPACGADTALDDDVVLGEVVWCGHCGAELEVIGLGPPLLELYEEEEK